MHLPSLFYGKKITKTQFLISGLTELSLSLGEVRLWVQPGAVVWRGRTIEQPGFKCQAVTSLLRGHDEVWGLGSHAGAQWRFLQLTATSVPLPRHVVHVHDAGLCMLKPYQKRHL